MKFFIISIGLLLISCGEYNEEFLNYVPCDPENVELYLSKIKVGDYWDHKYDQCASKIYDKFLETRYEFHYEYDPPYNPWYYFYDIYIKNSRVVLVYDNKK